MKFVELVNDSGNQLNVTQVRNMNFAPGESKKVSPETAKHPAVKRYIGAGLTVVTKESEDTKVVEEPKAPAPPPEEPKEETPEPVEPKADEELVEEPTEDPQETDGTDLRETYLNAPGVTDDNVDAVLGKFPAYDELAQASKTALTKLGVFKSYTSRLKDWAADQE